MKSRYYYLVILPFIFLLTSCVNNLQLEKRHYRNGFYFDGDKKQMLVHKNLNHAHSDTIISPKTTAFNTPKKELLNFQPSIDTSKTIFLNSEKFEQTKKACVKKIDHIKSSLKNKIQKASPVDNSAEASNIQRAFLLAILAIAFFILAIILTYVIVTSTPILLIAWPVAFIFSTCAFITGRKIAKTHKRGDVYEGKNKVIFAEVVGITGFALVAAGILLLAAVILALSTL